MGVVSNEGNPIFLGMKLRIILTLVQRAPKLIFPVVTQIYGKIQFTNPIFRESTSYYER